MDSVKNNSGFTLVELVVAVAVLGIITAISLPAINNIQTRNQEKKYTTYEDSILSSVKLYVDAYEEDEFDKSSLKAQCKAVKYEDLKNHNLLKEYDISGVKCQGRKVGQDENIAAYVYKGTDGKYEYYPMIYCQKNGKNVYGDMESSIPRTCEMSSNAISIASEDMCISTSGVDIDLYINPDQIKGDVAGVDYALIKSSDDGKESVIKNAVYNNLYVAGEQEGVKSIKVSANVSAGSKEYFLLVLRYKNDDGNFEYETLDPKITVNYEEPKITVIAKKWDDNSVSVTSSNYKKKAKDNYTFGEWSNKNIYLSATAKDGCGKVKKVKIDGNDSEYINVQEETEERVIKFSVKYGNNFTYEKEKTVKLDKIAPLVTMSARNEESSIYYVDKAGYRGEEILDISNSNTKNVTWYKNRIYYDTSIKDDLSGVDKTTWKWNNTNISPDATDKEKKSSDDSNISELKKKGLKETNYNFSLGANGYRQGWYTVTDQAGNITKIKIIALHDNETPKAPTSTVEVGSSAMTKQTNYNSTGTTWTNKSIQWNAFSAEENNPMSPVTYEYRDANASEITWKTLSTEYTYPLNNSKSMNWSFYIRAVDAAGNESEESGPFNFKIDQLKPTCSISASGKEGDNDWYKSNVSLSLTKSDTGGSDLTAYDLTTSSTTSYNKKTSGTQSSDTSGTTWYGHVKDAAGNVGTCSITVKKDSTAPTVTASPSAGTYSKKRKVKLTCADTTSGISESKIKFNSKEHKSSSTKVSFNFGATLEDKKATFTCTDKAGNTAETTKKYTVERKCPASTSIFGSTRDTNNYTNTSKERTYATSYWASNWCSSNGKKCWAEYGYARICTENWCKGMTAAELNEANGCSYSKYWCSC